jgi:tRNA modification GTPase
LVEQIYIDKSLDTSNDAMIVNARQNAAITSALKEVRSAADCVRFGLPLEICCSDIEAAMKCLSELDGRAVSEDIVSEIFSKFCVGK